MIAYAIEQWNKNKERLKEELKNDPFVSNCDVTYLYLVKKVVTTILNDEVNPLLKWDHKAITEIDNGDYSGTLLYLIPRDLYEPDESDYLITYVGYGSCSGCDTLKSIEVMDSEDARLKDYMSLCKDIVCNIKKPYERWNDARFREIEMDAQEAEK